MKLSKICRICLKSYEKRGQLKSVFENDEENVKIAKKIYDVSGIFIEKNLNTPEKICRLCLETLNISYKFKQLCQQSDIKIKSSECKDELYVKNILKSTATDFCNKHILKIESKHDISDSIYVNEPKMEEDSTDYEHLKVISPDNYIHPGELFMSQGPYNSANNESESILNEIETTSEYILVENKGYEYDESCENLSKSNIPIPKKTKDKTEKVSKNQNRRSLCIFKMEWMQTYDFLQPGDDNNSATCISCNCQLALAHKGESTIRRHMKTAKHLANSGFKIIQKLENASNKEGNVHICDICGNKYTTLHMLKRHMKYHSDVLDYECEICQKKFRQMMQLKRHMRIHTGEKPYSCKFCNKAIRDYSTKIRHERLHTGERPYVCPTCNKGFQYPFVLKNHIKIHTGEKLYECIVCSKNFTLKKHLTSHLETMLHKSRAQKLEEQKQSTIEDKPN